MGWEISNLHSRLRHSVWCPSRHHALVSMHRPLPVVTQTLVDCLATLSNATTILFSRAIRKCVLDKQVILICMIGQRYELVVVNTHYFNWTFEMTPTLTLYHNATTCIYHCISFKRVFPIIYIHIIQIYCGNRPSIDYFKCITYFFFFSTGDRRF